MTLRSPISYFFLALIAGSLAAQSSTANLPAVFGYRDFTAQARIEERFLAVPDAKLASQHLKVLTSEPHAASTPEDRKTAEYVAQKFRAAGLDTEIVPYRVLMNQPKAMRVEAYDQNGKRLLSGLTGEHVEGDPYQDDARVGVPFNGSSASGEATADVVYANYGRLEDFELLAAQHIDLRGKIVLIRYGACFRGVKVYLAEQRGAAGVLLYSDPKDDGASNGESYPMGPWRPESGVERGSVQYIFKSPGDPETPGFASTLDLPDSVRLPPDGSQPRIPSIPISAHDAAPILRALKGPVAPQDWQGGLPFRYHIGGGVKVHMVSEQEYQRRIIWDVIGKVKGTEYPDEWVVVGNHRDAWVYGAVDPGSGSAAMLEAVHGVGALLKSGWRPKRTLIFGSWDAEEEGLIGSTEWVEQHGKELEGAVAYFNTDIAVSGPDFSASATPSLKPFLRAIARSVSSPLGGTVYQQWRINHPAQNDERGSGEEIHMGDLGSGSDFTSFFEHAGVPSTDIGSGGPYGVYHSVFDNYAWFTMNADPHFAYLQEMARILGLEALRMADADVLPYDYIAYADAISMALEASKHKAQASSGLGALEFAPAQAASSRFAAAARKAHERQAAASGDLVRLNQALRQCESDLLSEAGLPGRPWYRHTIFAPGEYAGYAAVVIPGVNEALSARDRNRASQQLTVLTQALDRAARTLIAVQ